MSIIDKLASSLGRKDNLPNQQLAKEIANANDKYSINELIALLKESKDKKIQSDCIKTLYEIGYLKPELIADNYQFFIELLQSKNNRLVWGGMIALNTISKVRPKEIYENLGKIMETIDKGSVITKDNGVGILINLYATPDYESNIFPLIMEELKKCEPKQLPLYSERLLPVIKENNKNEFVDLLKIRITELEKETQRKRIEKIIKKIEINKHLCY